MFLKQLQLTGFKSVPENISLEFEPGFTAIVGPNGCGKSNIADAIRWVIGEQSYKTLRASKMEDVIFNGTQKRKPMGMAEVSLTFTNIPENISSRFSAYNEIKVTRRLFRSGESEYRINKVPCRLKDIVDIFLDTGVNTRGFSIIEQGQIHAIINSKPSEKRTLIENVAGIIKYNNRKTEALRKLAASEQNLTRITDITGELQRQINSMSRQAKKAEIYKNNKSELQELSCIKFSFEYNNFKKEITSLEIMKNDLKNKDVEFSVQVLTLNNKTEEEKVILLEKEKELERVKRQLIDLDNQIVRTEDKIGMINTQITGFEENDMLIQDEIDGLKKKSIDIEKMIEEQKSSFEGCADEINKQEKIYKEKKEELNSLVSERDECQEIMERLELEIMADIDKISQINNHLASMRTKREMLIRNKERLQSEEQDAEEMLVSVQSKLKDKAASVDEYQAKLDKLKVQKEETGKLLIEKKEALTVSDNDIRNKNDSLSSKQATLKSLIELQNNYDGFEDGVKEVLKLKETPEYEGIRGVVVDMLETSEEYEPAIEAVLGTRLQGIIVDGHNDTKTALQHLKTRGAGRSTFIPFQPKMKSKEKNVPVSSDNGIMGKALNLVRFKDEYKNVLELLLGDVVIASDFEAAFKMWNGNGNHYTIVTLDGDIIDPCGTVTGGKSVNTDGSLLKKKRYILELEKDVSSLKATLDDAKNKRETIFISLNDLEQQKETLEKNVHQTELDFANEKRDLQQLEDELSRYKNRLETHMYENQQIIAEEKELEKEIKSNESNLSVLSKKKDGQEDILKENKEKVMVARNTVTTLAEEVQSLELSLVSIKSKNKNIKFDIERLIKSKEDVEVTLKLKIVTQKDAETKKTNSEKSLEENEEMIVELTLKGKKIKKEIVEQETNVNSLRSAVYELEAEAKELENRYKKMSEEKNKTEMKKSELEFQLQFLIEKITEDFQLNIEEILQQYKYENLDIEETDKKIQALKTGLLKLGDVNLSALEEYAELNERYTFMMKQVDDLKQSLALLHDVINKINRTTKKLFIETFDKVKENFDIAFKRLFRGGRAELSLTDPDNILETGVEIAAQPTGKRFQSMNLLSAGEKTMTSIALLFAMFMVKPSPFCLLDEIDAPLDESNILRLKDMLNELSDKTQFIIITHNQKTMAFADRLYGVTMEEEGVSRVVSVDLNESRKFAEKRLEGV